MKMTVIERITFDSENPGKHLVVLGAVHGNEKCGTAAIRRITPEIESGEIKLKAGKVTFVPIANPRAYEENKRFVERNLNRHLYPKDAPVHYEDHLTSILCGILDETDALLDLHSFQSLGTPFCFLGTSSAEEIDFCHALGVVHFIYGWSDAFGNSSTNSDPYESMGTTEYTRHKKGIATTLECGHHDDKDAPAIAYNAILNALVHFGMTEEKHATRAKQKHHYIKMKTVFYKESPGAFVQPWKHLDQVNAGDVIARYDNGEEIRAPEDGYLVLPKGETDRPTGSEWVYFGVETNQPQPQTEQPQP